MTTLLRSRDEVVKTMPSALADDPFLTALSGGGVEALQRYVDGLRDAGLPLPDDLLVEEGACGTEVRHRWISGPTLLELPAWRSAEFLAAVTRIARWVRALEPTDVRLDANLANFVLSDDEHLVCIDVLPPLLVALRPPETDLWGQVIGGLCFDTDITLCALAGYAARHLVRVLDPGALAATDVQCVISLCPGHPEPTALPALWFHSRLHAAELALAGRLPRQQALDLFTATSVLALRATPAAVQPAHVAAVLELVSSLSGRRNA